MTTKLTRIFFTGLMLSAMGSLTAEPEWSLVSISQEQTPQAFRRTVDPIITPDWGNPSQDGYYRLNASASGAFSEPGFSWLQTRIPRSQVVFVDLREESHGFVNGNAVSWRDGDNWQNKGLSPEEIEAAEAKLLQQAADSGSITIGAHSMPVETVKTERELVEESGSRYLRMPIRSNAYPTDDEVEAFVSLWKETPRGTWIHFTSEKGDVRATTLMIMQDMMYNAKAIKFDHILKRQHLVGGADFLNPASQSKQEKWLGIRRYRLLEDFYHYCQTEGFDYNQSWKSWKDQLPY